MHWGVFGGLRIRLILLMLLALFPLGLIALWQTYRVVEENGVLVREMLVDLTAAAAAKQQSQIQEAVGAGLALGASVANADPRTCRQAMARFVDTAPTFAFAGFIRVDGIMACSSAGEDVVDFSAFPSFADAVARADIFVEVNTQGAVTGKSVVIVNVPVFQADALAGFVSISIPQRMVAADPDRISRGNFGLAGIATSGEVFDIAAQADAARAQLPRDIAITDVLDRAGTTFEALDQGGHTRVFSVTPLIANSYVVVGSWQPSELMNRNAWMQAYMPLVFAVIMWGAGMLVAYFGLSRLVLRHLKDLRSAMRRFALGERRADGLDLTGAPDEFKDAERAFNRMAYLITEAEARQMTDLHDKEVLLREVHHRVKNNLQMIASIMNLQARSARTDEARDMLQGLQRRVRGLAMLHRTLYSEIDTAQVDAGDLAAAVVSDTSAMMPDRSVRSDRVPRIDADLTSVMLYPDQAVPLSMWLAEGLTNAVKYAAPDAQGTAQIKVKLAHDGAGVVDVTVENTVGQGVRPDDPDSTGLGAKLMNAFCRQLDGQVTVTDDGGHYVLGLRFTVQGFDPGTDDRPRGSGAADAVA